MQVLIADDDPVSRRLLQSYLQKWGHEVTVAVHGADAWAKFEQQPFPFVISDWMMPEMDGRELIRRIRAGGHTPATYTILLTARSEKADLLAGLEAGADDFVAKPFLAEELHVRVRAGERIVNLERELAALRAAAG